MKIYTKNVSDVGPCSQCGIVGSDEPYGDENVIEDKVNVVEIPNSYRHSLQAPHVFRLCDKCAVELRELLGDIE